MGRRRPELRAQRSWAGTSRVSSPMPASPELCSLCMMTATDEAPGGQPRREVLLPGGTSNRGLVVRVGDTVHRPQTEASAAVHDLLLHLESVGFEGAPRYLGQDEQGREILSYIDGEAAIAP